MESVVQAIEKIRSLPEALVDRNFGQGREAVLAQVEVLLGEPDTQHADNFIATAREALAELRTQVLPYQLPDDYIFSGVLRRLDDSNGQLYPFDGRLGADD